MYPDTDDRPLTSGERVRTALVLALFGVMAAFLQSACSPSYPRPPAAPRAMPDRGDTAVAIAVDCSGTAALDETWFARQGHGSGVVIDGRHVLTADHVVHCLAIPTVRVRFRGGQWRMVVSAEWPDRDLALLEVMSADNFGPIAPPIARPLGLEQAACAQHSWPASDGACGRVTRLGELTCKDEPSGHHWCHDVEFAAPSIPGNSGSPVYDADGNLVAILTGGNYEHDAAKNKDRPLGDMMAVRIWPFRGDLGLAE